MTARTLNRYVNSANYRIGVTPQEEAVSELEGYSTYQNAVTAVQMGLKTHGERDSAKL